MNLTKYAAAVSLLSLAVGAAPTHAQTDNQPLELEAISVMAGVGGGSGDGQLQLPNLGTNCIWPFSVSGFGVGVKVNVSKISASGPVKNLTKLDDFPGTYVACGGEVTVGVGRGAATLKNKANDVIVELDAQTVGIGLGVSGQGLTIDMPIPPENAPRAYVLEYGFQKGWLNADNRKALNDLVDAWKCRFVNLDVTGAVTARKPEVAELGVAAGERGPELPRRRGCRSRPHHPKSVRLPAGINGRRCASPSENRVVVVTVR